MAPRDPFKYPGGYRRYDNLRQAMEEFYKHSPIGLTQGGSSRKDRGAKSAANGGLADGANANAIAERIENA